LPSPTGQPKLAGLKTAAPSPPPCWLAIVDHAGDTIDISGEWRRHLAARLLRLARAALEPGWGKGDAVLSANRLTVQAGTASCPHQL